MTKDARSEAGLLTRATALLGALLLLLNPMLALAGEAHGRDEWREDDGHDQAGLSLKERVDLLRRKVKYVFDHSRERKPFRFQLLRHLSRRQRPLQRAPRRDARQRDAQLRAELP